MTSYILPQVPRSQTKKYPEIFEFMESKSLWYPVYYIIDSNLRKSVNVQSWSKEFIDKPSKLTLSTAATFNTKQHTDYLMTDILRWVEANIKYTGDMKSWKMSEYWQTPDETLTKKTGDCEDGAILIYALARACGVPANRMLLFAGSVDGGGHCWLGYRSDEYPLNWCFMDWCYWYDRTTPESRNKYYIKDTTIYNDPNNQYYTIWFGFNDKGSYKGILNK